MILFSYVSLHRHNIERGQEMSWAPPWGCCLLWKKFSKSEEQNCKPPPLPNFIAQLCLCITLWWYHIMNFKFSMNFLKRCISIDLAFIQTLFYWVDSIFPFCLTSLNIILTIKKTKFHSLVERLKSELIECWSKKKFWSKFGKETKTQLLENFQLDSVIIYFLNSWKIWISTNWKELYLFKKGFYL